MNRPPVCPWMILRRNEGEFIRAKTLVTQIWRVAGQKTQANVHPAFFECRLDLGGRNFFNRYADRWMIVGKRAKELRKVRHIHHRDNNQMQWAAYIPRFIVQLLEKI